MDVHREPFPRLYCLLSSWRAITLYLLIYGWHCWWVNNNKTQLQFQPLWGFSYLRTLRESTVGLSWIFKKSMGARNRGGRGLSYRPARLHRLAEFIPWTAISLTLSTIQSSQNVFDAVKASERKCTLYAIKYFHYSEKLCLGKRTLFPATD